MSNDGDTANTSPNLFSIAMSQARMETKLDSALSLGQDHEVRIRSLETDRDQHSFIRMHAPMLSASAAIISAICALVLLMVR